MVTLVAYAICALLWLVDTNIGDVHWWCWLCLASSVICCLGRQLGQWRLTRKELAILGGVELLMIVLVLIFAGFVHSPLFVVGTLVLVEQGHRIGTRWGLISGLTAAALVALGKWLTHDSNFDNPQFAFVFCTELAFWPLAGVLQLRLYAPEDLRKTISRAGGPVLAMSEMSETGIINLLNSTTNRLFALLDLFRQLDSERDLGKLMQNALKFAKENTKSEVAAFLFPKEGHLSVVFSDGEGVVPGNDDDGDMSVIRKVFESGEPYHYHSDHRSGGVRVPWLDRSVRAYMAVPMLDKVDKKPLGVLVIANSNNRADYEPGTIEFLSLLMAQIGVVVSNERLFEKLDMAAKDLSSALVKVLELKEEDSPGHVMRVVQNAIELAHEQGLSSEEVDEVAKGALLHDIGKVFIPDEILHKRGPLNVKELAIMKEHTIRARDILEGLSMFSDRVIEMIVHHHERYDGKGYPDGQAGEGICLGSRIIAIADTFDGLTGGRAEREGLPLEEALQIMADGEGTHFDPELLEQFVEMKKRKANEAA
ncbi:MAG: HD domain-containing phosphohydrolase [bacterium]|nr:HD domain-containing phosphohydrolase [bacterium]